MKTTTIAEFLNRFDSYASPEIDISQKALHSECTMTFCNQVTVGMNEALISFVFTDTIMHTCYLVSDDSEGRKWAQSMPQIGARPHRILRLVQSA